jgi:hypothetical protein
MIAIEQPVADRQDAIECASKQEEKDQAKLGINDEPVISIDKLSYCGHDKPPEESLVLPYLAASVSCGDRCGLL